MKYDCGTCLLLKCYIFINGFCGHTDKLYVCFVDIYPLQWQQMSCRWNVSAVNAGNVAIITRWPA